jgi:hypothetical protein
MPILNARIRRMLTIKLPRLRPTTTTNLTNLSKSDYKFGLLSYRESNLGDDAQALAAREFMPRVDYFVHRDSIGNFAPSASDDKVKIILNGWFMGSRSWPPAESIEPLFVSFHIGQHHYDEDKKWGGKSVLLEKSSIAYLKERGPIGCRDISTLKLLEAKGVEAYFSGCLTLTLGSILKKPIETAAREEILLVEPNLDLRTLFESIPLHLRPKTSFVTHQTTLTGPPELRLSTVSAMLHRYASAKLVITSRLHCALPCLALGTPVVFVPPAHDLDRFSGIWELLNVARVSDGALIEAVPWNAPIPNPDGYRPLAEQLSQRCRQFFNTSG